MFGIPGKKLLKISQNGECTEEDVECESCSSLLYLSLVLAVQKLHKLLKESVWKIFNPTKSFIYVSSENCQDAKKELGEGISWFVDFCRK